MNRTDLTQVKVTRDEVGKWKLTIDRPEAATRLIQRITTCAARESNPVVGSSKNKIAGFAASSTAIDNRFFCSKLIPPLA